MKHPHYQKRSASEASAFDDENFQLENLKRSKRKTFLKNFAELDVHSKETQRANVFVFGKQGQKREIITSLKNAPGEYVMSVRRV